MTESSALIITRPSEYVVVPNDSERYVPKPGEYVGHPIAPNWFCRGWNGTRHKYCRQRAGMKTDHPGVGRCNVHGGRAPKTHGLRSRYRVVGSSMKERFARFENDPDLLNMRSEIVVLTALLDDALGQEELNRDACTQLAEALSKAKDRIHTLGSKQAFSIEAAKRWFFNVDRIIDVYVTDTDLANKIKIAIADAGV